MALLAEPTPKELPAAIASSDGERAVEILEFEGARGIQNRDAVGYYYTVRLEPDGDPSRVVVVFSGTVFHLGLGSLGLPVLDDKERLFCQLGIAAVGDFLDIGEEIPFTPSGVPAHQVECFSGHFQSWKDREPASDEEIEAYLRSQVFWAWKYSRPHASIDLPDTVRLRRDLPRIDKMVQLAEGSSWNAQRMNGAILLKATNAFISALRGGEPVASMIESDMVHGDEDEDTVRPSEDPEDRQPSLLPFVDDVRIAALKKHNLESDDWDLSRLIALCEELNTCYRSQCYHAVAALTRTVLNHVPSVFGYRTFSEVASNYAGGGKSFKEAMQHLEGGARKISDHYLHQTMRRTETLPTRTQVVTSRQLDPPVLTTLMHPPVTS